MGAGPCRRLRSQILRDRQSAGCFFFALGLKEGPEEESGAWERARRGRITGQLMRLCVLRATSPSRSDFWTSKACSPRWAETMAEWLSPAGRGSRPGSAHRPPSAEPVTASPAGSLTESPSLRPHLGVRPLAGPRSRRLLPPTPVGFCAVSRGHTDLGRPSRPRLGALPPADAPPDPLAVHIQGHVKSLCPRHTLT